MKYLTICRHAKSGWGDQTQSDHERTLDSRGNDDAHLVGKHLNLAGTTVDHIVCSSASRALSTAEIFAQEMQLALPINQEPRIYEASVSTLQLVVESLPNEKNAVMLFGHNPGFESLCNYIDPGSITTLTTCNVVQYQLNIEHWLDFDFSCGKLIKITTPKKL